MKKNKIKTFFDIIQAEMTKNEDFKNRIESLFEPEIKMTSKNTLRAKNKREPAVLDPIEIFANNGESELKINLNRLDVEKLKDIVSQFRFDSSRIVMKWKDKNRLIEHIIKSAQSREQKGDVFRK